VDTALEEAVFTLDNGKSWYIKFVYDFMYKCIDMRKVHFIEGDTDSLYYAISCDPEKDCHQGFEDAIKDEAFYKENMYKWFPNPQLGTKDKKKLLGVSFEKVGYVMYAIAPKCYILKGNKTSDKEDVRKMKGVSVRLNDDIDLMSYKSCLESSVRMMAINRGYMMIESNPLKHIRRMEKYKQRKNVVNGLALDKMIVFKNYPCAPFLPNLTLHQVIIKYFYCLFKLFLKICIFYNYKKFLVLKKIMSNQENENDNEMSDIIAVDNSTEFNKAVCKNDKENREKRKIKLLHHHHRSHHNNKHDSEIEMMMMMMR
jgi:hypothetical protein